MLQSRPQLSNIIEHITQHIIPGLVVPIPTPSHTVPPCSDTMASFLRLIPRVHATTCPYNVRLGLSFVAVSRLVFPSSGQGEKQRGTRAREEPAGGS